MPSKVLQELAFSAYALAYLTWNKTVPRDELDKMIDAQTKVRTAASGELSGDDTAKFDVFISKFRGLMLQAFDLGRHDASLNPCPF